MNEVLRLDQLLVSQGLARSRAQSQKLISAGFVSVNIAGKWQTITKPAAKFVSEIECRVSDNDHSQYVSRAGLKLAGALRHTGVDVSGCCALDIGQSTGGFTDCLLQHGAEHVVGVDVGHSQLAADLRDHPRVCSVEKCNARELSPSLLQERSGVSTFDLIVMDVSFISQSLIWPRLPALLAANGRVVSLVKPQFEVGPEGVGKGGLVRDASLYGEVERRLRGELQTLGLSVDDFFPSPILGGDGNREFFLLAAMG